MFRFIRYLISSFFTILFFFVFIAIYGDSGYGFVMAVLSSIGVSSLIGILFSNILYYKGF